MHFKILEIHLLEEISGKVFGNRTGTGNRNRISGRNRIQPDIRSVPTRGSDPGPGKCHCPT